MWGPAEEEIFVEKGLKLPFLFTFSKVVLISLKN